MNRTGRQYTYFLLHNSTYDLRCGLTILGLPSERKSEHRSPNLCHLLNIEFRISPGNQWHQRFKCKPDPIVLLCVCKGAKSFVHARSKDQYCKNLHTNRYCLVTIMCKISSVPQIISKNCIQLRYWFQNEGYRQIEIHRQVHIDRLRQSVTRGCSYRQEGGELKIDRERYRNNCRDRPLDRELKIYRERHRDRQRRRNRERYRPEDRELKIEICRQRGREIAVMFEIVGFIIGNVGGKDK